MRVLLISALTLVTVSAFAAAKKPTPKKGKAKVVGVVVVHATAGHNVKGVIWFIQEKGYVHVKGTLSGLTPGKHGFHVHQFGDCSKSDGTSAGGHFNPKKMKHGAPQMKMRHDGDLGNIVADKQGNAQIEWKDKTMQLKGPRSIIGRGVIVHAKEDDLKTQPTGNAGARVGCGVIGWSK
ncbi:MAG: superoxide dismutase family protein [Myxococcales bacterium]|nr:superoxide dismutase family protein [Myxococcales bacterium]